MNALVLSNFIPGKLYLVLASRSIGRPMANEFISRLALVSPVIALDGGGSSFDPLFIARQLRHHVPDYIPLLDRVQIARAFTCHELVTLLEQETNNTTPVVILDFLSLLDDENLTSCERQAVFSRLVHRLQIICKDVPVLVWTRPAVLPHTQLLAKELVELSDQVLTFQVPAQLEQARLFP